MLNYFFAQVFKGIEKTAIASGYKVITTISNESLTKENEIVEMLSNGTIDGFIVSLSKETELENDYSHLQDTIDNGIPIVMFDRVAQNIECDKVITDDYSGAIDTVKFLYKKGHKKIAFATTMSNLHIGQQRLEGYKKGLENVGLEFRPELVLEIHEKDYKKYESLFIPFIKDNEIDAIITTGESAAVASMKASLKNGYEIPKDIAVIAFSNGILARHSSPKMTTISQHGEIMGEKAASILIEKLKNKDKEKVTEVIKTDLVIRDSTRR